MRIREPMSITTVKLKVVRRSGFLSSLGRDVVVAGTLIECIVPNDERRRSKCGSSPLGRPSSRTSDGLRSTFDFVESTSVTVESTILWSALRKGVVSSTPFRFVAFVLAVSRSIGFVSSRKMAPWITAMAIATTQTRFGSRYGYFPNKPSGGKTEG